MTAPRVVEASPDDDGRRLDVVLADRLGGSRSQAAARIARGEVTDAEGRVLAKSHRVTAGERLTVAPPPTEPAGAAGVPPPPIRFEDEHVLVVDKPAGLVVHPGTGNPAGTLVQALSGSGYDLAPAAGDDRPGIVHRLDRDTSGLLVVAKTDAAYRPLVAALRRREVERRYLALVEGGLHAPSVRIEAPIGRDPTDRKRFAALADGKHAVTVVEHTAAGRAEGRDVTFLGCRLETGRTHQIRVHLRYAGHPVVGDTTYGADGGLARAVGLDRLFLHAHALGFSHPVTGERIEVESPLPPDLAAALAAVGLAPTTA